MKLINIDKLEFDRIEGIRKVITHDYAQRFAYLDLGNSLGMYGISWTSTSLEPIILFSEEQNTVWLGVDRQVAAIALETGRILMSLPLNINIVQIQAIGQVTAVLTEEEILLFNPGCSLRLHEDLPEQGISLSFKDENLIVKMLDGEILTIDPMTGIIEREILLV
ncbi:MAG: hypothetical protein AB4290_04725 [Spirulina sp.]